MQTSPVEDNDSLLEKLPVELIYEIQSFTLSESLPIVTKRIHSILNATHANYRAEYILLRYLTPSSPSSSSPAYTRGELITHALQYPLCTEDVLDALLRLASSSTFSSYWTEATATGSRTDAEVREDPRPLIPKRLFKRLSPRSVAPFSLKDEPLPFLRYLYSLSSTGRFRPPNPNAHEGYALSRAVHAGHVHLVKFLLSKGAKPDYKKALAVRIAIKKRDLGLVRMLIEREAENVEFGVEVEDAITRPCKTLHASGADEVCDCKTDGVKRSSEPETETRKKRRKTAKRRRVEDRLEVTTSMLLLAVELDARDIVRYFLDKGARPDMSTIQRMRRIGFV